MPGEFCALAPNTESVASARLINSLTELKEILLIGKWLFIKL